MRQLFDNHNVLVCAGSGGIGKTTLSAAIGVSAAMAGKKVLVLTIDPAKRLATALGLKEQGDETVVPGQKFPGELSAAMIDAEAIFESFIREAMKNESKAEALLNNQLYKQLSTTLSGSQEFTSLAKLTTAAQSGKYDLIILDTPPTQHAIDFLHAPEKIYALFQDSITKWFISSKEDKNILRKIIHKGTRTVFSALEKITGAQFMRELSDFFDNVSLIQKPISQKSIDAQKLLLSEKTGFVLITGFDEAKLKEAEFFNKELKRGGFRLAFVIVNRCFPFWLESGQEKETDQPNEEMAGLYKKFLKYHQSRLESYRKFEAPLKEQVSVVRIPDMNKDLSGLDSLEELARELDRRFP